MTIKEHINMILDKYNLKHLYNKYIAAVYVSLVMKEGFYWLLIYYNEFVKTNINKLQEITIMLLIIYGFNIPIDRLCVNTKDELCSELNKANYNYFNNIISNMSKIQLLNIDLVKYNNTLLKFNENMETYIKNIKNKLDIPIRSLNIIIIAYTKKYYSMYFILPLLYIIIIYIYNNKIITEEIVKKKEIDALNSYKDYITTSKNLLMNNNINNEYLQQIIQTCDNHSNDLKYIDKNINTKITLLIYISILLVFYKHYHQINYNDFIYYFIIIYDIELFTDKIGQYYEGKNNYNGMFSRLEYLNSFISNDKNVISNIDFDKIKITKIKNKIPYLNLINEIIINKGDHILIDGLSGSGKTSLLYILKSVFKPDEIIIEPAIDTIAHKVFISLSGQKNLYNGKLYNIISDHKKYDINVIQKVINLAKIKYTDNVDIDINLLSGGEKSRLLIAKILYINEIYDYNIFLFDEIDDNLDNDMAYIICQNILKHLSNKIILYITHNNHVKTLFNKIIKVNQGDITYNII